MTSKSSKTTEISHITRGIPSKVPAKTSVLSHARHSWLTIVVGLIAAAGIIGIVIVSILSFVVLRPSTGKLNVLFIIYQRVISQ